MSLSPPSTNATILSQMAPQDSQMTRSRHEMSRADADDDGVISKGELAKARERFARGRGGEARRGRSGTATREESAKEESEKEQADRSRRRRPPAAWFGQRGDRPGPWGSRPDGKRWGGEKDDAKAKQSAKHPWARRRGSGSVALHAFWGHRFSSFSARRSTRL